jgi:SAM-dependent methyltransferase
MALGHLAVALLSCLVTILIMQSNQQPFTISQHRSLAETTTSLSTTPSACLTHNLVTPTMISNLYNEKVVKSPEYYSTYTNVTFWSYYLRKKYSVDTSVRDMARLWPILDFHDWVEKYQLSTPKKLLSTYHTDAELKFVHPKEKIEFKYSTKTQDGDLHILGTSASHMQQRDFDLVIISQTFEHLYDPYLCAINIFQVMAPGGYFFTSAPAQNIPHMTPIHFQHFRPMGFVLLFARAGFEIVEYGEWGNKEYERLVLASHRWPNYATFQSLTKRPNLDHLNNDGNTNPYQMWILVRKPLN